MITSNARKVFLEYSATNFLLFIQRFQEGDLRFDLDEDGQVGFTDFLLFA